MFLFSGIPKLYAIKLEQDVTNYACRGSSGLYSTGDGALFGPDQNGYPSLSL